MTIKNAALKKILNSAGSWTIEVSIELDNGSLGKFSVPGGLSKGKNEVANVTPEVASQKL